MRRWLAYELSKNDRSLLGFWPLLENTRDYSGLGNHAAPVNGCGPTSYGGYRGWNLTSPGYLNCGLAPDINFGYTNDFTISFWICQNNSYGPPVIGNVNTSGIGWLAEVSQGNITFNFTNPNSITGESVTSWSFNQSQGWTHVVIRYHGSGASATLLPVIQCFVNGHCLDSTGNAQVTLNNTTQGKLLIGCLLDPFSNVSNYGPGAAKCVRVYNRSLPNSEISSLYAREKSTDIFGRPEFNNFSFVSLFIQGMIPSTANIPLALIGGGPSNNIPLYTAAFIQFDGPTAPLFIDGDIPSPSSIPLYIAGSANSINSNIPLFVQGNAPTSGSIPLFTLGANISSGLPFNSLYLFTPSPIVNPFSNNIPLIAYNTAVADANSIPMVAWNTVSENNGSIPLFMQGVLGSLQQNVNLYVNGWWYSSVTSGVSLFVDAPGATTGINLFTSGPLSLNQHCSFYTSGIPVSFGSIPLFILPTLSSPSGMSLYTQGPLSPSRIPDTLLDLVVGGVPPIPYSGGPTLPLMVYGLSGGNASFRSVSLFLPGATTSLSGQMNLFVSGFDAGPWSSNMNLFVGAVAPNAHKSTPLVSWNSQNGTTNSVSLFVLSEGIAVLSDTPQSGNMNLFINRPTDGWLPLYIGANGTTNSMWLYTNGMGTMSGTPDITLALPYITASGNASFPMYTHGF